MLCVVIIFTAMHCTSSLSQQNRCSLNKKFITFQSTKMQTDTETWHLLGLGSGEETIRKVENVTKHSIVSEIYFDHVSKLHSGAYSCRAMRIGETAVDDLRYTLDVMDSVPASVDLGQTNLDGGKVIFRPGDVFTFRDQYYKTFSLVNDSSVEFD